MKYTIIEGRRFKKLLKKIARKHRTIENDLQTAKDNVLSIAPDLMSEYIPGLGGNVAKFRMPISASNIGKSGGRRIIFLKVEEKKTIYLLYIYLKSEKSNISNKEIEEILSELGDSFED